MDDLRKTGQMPAANVTPLVASARPSLLVSGASGAYKMPLPDGDLTIGRDAECTLRLDDPLASRKHATLRVGQKISIVDHGSSNGTKVGGNSVPSNVDLEIGVGDVISIGSTVLVLQPAWSGGRARHIWTHGYFEARVEDECARAEHGGRHFAIVRLRFPAGARAQDRLIAQVRPMDVVASYAPDDYEILIVDCDAHEAERLALELVRVLGGPEAGIACYARDGRTPEDLLARASQSTTRDSVASIPQVSAAARDGAIRRLEPLLRRVATGALPALILGETGVGKEVVARFIHEWSPRADKPYVCVNCAAIAETLLESELFGHERGAFTGATHAKPGLLESANGGTVLLDEIGEMPFVLQAKLLRVIEQREVVRVGALQPRKINVRFLAATHRNLEAEIVRGRFRQDLYFRLAGIEILVPPLRDRVDEIAPLAISFAKDAAARLGVRRAPQISDEAVETLEGYGWPGNVRELRNVIERAVLLSSTGGRITTAHLPLEKMGTVLPSPSTFVSPQPPPVAAARVEVPVKVTTRLPATRPEDQTLNDAGGAERKKIVDALRACSGNQTLAAKMLGISRRTLVSRLNEYDLPRPRKDRDD
jgi:two-component system response regulator AtoC